MQKDKKMDPQRTIVLYTSKYGAAETYAQWIAEALGCQAVSLDKFSKKELQGYDTVIYGGGVQAGGVRGLEQFTKWIKGDLKLRQMAKRGTISEAEAAEIGAFDRQYYIFAVGISLDSEENRLQLRDINFDKNWLREVPLIRRSWQALTRRLSRSRRRCFWTSRKRKPPRRICRCCAILKPAAI